MKDDTGTSTDDGFVVPDDRVQAFKMYDDAKNALDGVRGQIASLKYLQHGSSRELKRYKSDMENLGAAELMINGRITKIKAKVRELSERDSADFEAHGSAAIALARVMPDTTPLSTASMAAFMLLRRLKADGTIVSSEDRMVIYALGSALNREEAKTVDAASIWRELFPSGA